MKFLIDADCPRRIGTRLKQFGHEVIDIRDIKPSAADQEIYNLIKKESCILITRDTDFSNILYYPVESNFGIILLRVYLMTVSEIVRLIDILLETVSRENMFGSLIVVQRNKIRIRKM